MCWTVQDILCSCNRIPAAELQQLTLLPATSFKKGTIGRLRCTVVVMKRHLYSHERPTLGFVRCRQICWFYTDFILSRLSSLWSFFFLHGPVIVLRLRGLSALQMDAGDRLPLHSLYSSLLCNYLFLQGHCCSACVAHHPTHCTTAQWLSMSVPPSLPPSLSTPKKKGGTYTWGACQLLSDAVICSMWKCWFTTVIL